MGIHVTSIPKIIIPLWKLPKSNLRSRNFNLTNFFVDFGMIAGVTVSSLFVVAAGSGGYFGYKKYLKVIRSFFE